MARLPVTQSTLDAIWGVVDNNPSVHHTAVAKQIGCSTYLVWKVRAGGIRTAHSRPYVSPNKNTAQVKPKHIKAEQFTDEWWQQNDQAFRAAMMEAAE